MEKFNFKFERLLDYKKTLENHKKSEYRNIQQKLIKEEEILKNYCEFKNELKKKKNESSNKINVASLQLYNNYINDMNEIISTQKELVNKAENQLKTVKSELLEIRKEKRAFERLKENKHEEYLYCVKKEEEKLIDTIVSFKGSTR